jgi:hypothetical protein
MKKMSLFAALVLAGVVLTAQSAGQSAPKKILSAREVGSFISEKSAIEEDLGALGNKYDDYFADMDAGSTDEANPDPLAAFGKLRAMKIPAEIQDVMKKHGLGDNGFEKYIVITYGFGALYLERQIDAQLTGQEITPEMKPYVDQMRLVATQMKAGVHASDINLISDRYDDLFAVMNAEN